MTNNIKIFLAAIGIAIFLMATNSFIHRSLKEIDDTSSFQTGAKGEAPVVVPVKAEEAAVPIQQGEGEIVRRNRVIPGDDYEESVFYQEGKEIARQKIVHGKILEQTGQVPDGKVHVEDQYQQTSGDEFYVNGKRNGVSRLYYEGGMLRRETTYQDGKEILVKEYFNNGAVHFTEDFRDALDIPGEAEVGVGKVYFPDGKLRYEWNLTRSNRRGYKRAYNQLGELVAEVYFDDKGQAIK